LVSRTGIAAGQIIFAGAHGGPAVVMLALTIFCLTLALIAAALFFDNLLRFRRAPSAAADPSLDASVLVPARNEEAAIAGCLDSILACRDPRLEVIVLDDGSTDHTAAIVRDIASR